MPCDARKQHFNTDIEHIKLSIMESWTTIFWEQSNQTDLLEP